MENTKYTLLRICKLARISEDLGTFMFLANIMQVDIKAF